MTVRPAWPENGYDALVSKTYRLADTIFNHLLIQNAALLKFDSMKFKNEVAIVQSIPVDPELSFFRLRLFYKKELMDYMVLRRQEPSIQKPGWFKSIVNRVDPNYAILEQWIKGLGKIDGKDFERGVAILFCLCGLNTLHVGGNFFDIVLIHES